MKDLVCISHLRWDFVWQRPQHLLSRLAKTYRVLFVEEPVASTTAREPELDITTRALDNGASIRVARLIYPTHDERWIGHGDALVQPTYERLLDDYLHMQRFDDPLLWLYTPMAADFSDSIDHSLLIVDVMDQLSAFKGAPRELAQNEALLLPLADVIFTGGVSLYRDKHPFNANTHLFPSGVEVEHFARAQNSAAFNPPPPLDTLNGVVIGYYGVIDERMDMPLLASVAAQRPDWQIVLIGPIVKIDPQELPQAPNIHYVGMKSYHELPAYLAHFDVATIPFALNESTRNVSPTKTLEYMAARKPILSTPIHDVVELYSDIVYVADTPKAFIKGVEAALKDDGSRRREREDQILHAQTWDSIVERMKRVLQKRLGEKQPARRMTRQTVTSRWQR
jgi:glycosyltransferase involved in cell wall biosynthesis